MKDHYQTIGIVCWGLMGDVLMRTPVIHAIRRIFPAAKISAIVDPIGEEVLRHNPDVNEIILFDRKKKPKWKYLFNKIAGIAAVRRHRFDLLIDLYGGGSSSNLLRLSGAAHRIGFTHGQLSANTYNLPFERETAPVSSLHITRSLLKIVSVFEHDFEAYSTRPLFFTRSEVDEKMNQTVQQFGFETPYLLNFGSGGAEKILSMKKSFQQVKFLYENYGCAPLIICNPGQEELQRQFAQTYMRPSNIPFGVLPLLSLEEIGSIMKACRFIITPDTGLYHIAAAIGIPILGIFTYTDPKLVEPDSGIYVHCFQPDPLTVDESIRFGKRDLDVEHILERTAFFIDQLPKGER